MEILMKGFYKTPKGIMSYRFRIVSKLESRWK